MRKSGYRLRRWAASARDRLNYLVYLASLNRDIAKRPQGSTLDVEPIVFRVTGSPLTVDVSRSPRLDAAQFSLDAPPLEIHDPHIQLRPGRFGMAAHDAFAPPIASEFKIDPPFGIVGNDLEIISYYRNLEEPALFQVRGMAALFHNPFKPVGMYASRSGSLILTQTNRTIKASRVSQLLVYEQLEKKSYNMFGGKFDVTGTVMTLTLPGAPAELRVSRLSDMVIYRKDIMARVARVSQLIVYGG